MIQRIQTIYLLISLICLGFVSFGMNIFSYLGEKSRYDISAFGVDEIDLANGSLINGDSSLMCIIGFGLMLVGLATLLSFKNLKRQFKFGRMFFFTYLMVLLTTMSLIYAGESYIAKDITGRELDLGFFLLVLGFPFTFLANTGIKRDKKLIESLDRLR
jgi:hypothetical protein